MSGTTLGSDVMGDFEPHDVLDRYARLNVHPVCNTGEEEEAGFIDPRIQERRARHESAGERIVEEDLGGDPGGVEEACLRHR